MNLTLCYYAISDREKLKRCFCRMLQISSGDEDDNKYYPTDVSCNNCRVSPLSGSLGYGALPTIVGSWSICHGELQ